jgi:hypothetical protein
VQVTLDDEIDGEARDDREDGRTDGAGQGSGEAQMPLLAETRPTEETTTRSLQIT